VNTAEARQLALQLEDEIAKAVVGQERAVRLLLVCLLSGGHMLLEGPPGVAKTFLAQCFARASGLDFGRIQFTPDLLPGDIVGSNLFNFQTSTFALIRGPVFTELLLADEINRAPPRTQAALLEAMQERAVTLDGKTHPLSPRFMVVATQNPIESQGVYVLPEAQLDRFLFKHTLSYPSLDEELRIVGGHGALAGAPRPETFGVTAVADREAINSAIAAVSATRLSAEVTGYVVSLIRATREAPDLALGASPRAAVMLANASRANAALEGRDYVIPDDVKALAPSVLRHRVAVSPAAEIEGRTADSVVAAIIAGIEAPR
jgi:MoxR-like ATPase